MSDFHTVLMVMAGASCFETQNTNKNTVHPFKIMLPKQGGYTRTPK